MCEKRDFTVFIILYFQITSELLDLPSEFWQTFMRESEITHNENDMQKTPSSHSLRSFFPSSGRVK